MGTQHFSPGRALNTDDFYKDEDLHFEATDSDDLIWDLEEMHVDHPTGLGLVGDEALEGPHAGKGPKGYTRADRLIHEDVCETLKAHPGVDASDIDVTVDKGLVVLKGTVLDRGMRRLAESCVEYLPGVVDVRNELKAVTGVSGRSFPS